MKKKKETKKQRTIAEYRQTASPDSNKHKGTASSLEEITAEGERQRSLRWRMYGLVPYNLSEIQKGIQYGHAVVEYAEHVMSRREHNIPYYTWARRDKTFVILNGGTTSTNPESPGTMNLHAEMLRVMDVDVAVFFEPDLGDQLTAAAFLVDERVWDRETYPDFVSGFESIEETNEEAHYSQMWGEDWRSLLQLRLFIGQFKVS